MLVWPDWNKLYAKWQCLYFWVPFNDEQWSKLNACKTQVEKDKLIREWREEYMKNVDLVNGKLLQSAEVKPAKAEPVVEQQEETAEEPAEEEPAMEESIEDVKPAKAKKGK